MGGVSAAWLRAMQTAQRAVWLPERGPQAPLLPWIAPHVPQPIFEMIERLGTVRQLEPGDYVFASHERVNRLVYVRSGVTGRAVVDPASNHPEAMAISPPGRLGAGNLNFFSARPCAGRYFAICRSEIVSCPQTLLLTMAKRDLEFGLLLVHYFELCSLSDRLGFATQVLLPVPLRLQVFFLSWACSFGQEAEREDLPGRWLKMPVPPARPDIARVIYASLISIDRLLCTWRQSQLLLREGEQLWLRPELLRDAHAWLCRTEESASGHPRPSELTDMLR